MKLSALFKKKRKKKPSEWDEREQEAARARHGEMVQNMVNVMPDRGPDQAAGHMRLGKAF